MEFGNEWKETEYLRIKERKKEKGRNGDRNTVRNVKWKVNK